MTEPKQLILISLLTGPKHGYAIQVDLQEVTGTWMGPGTLYAALVRLEQDGLIEAMPAEDRRRPYRITGGGRDFIEIELKRTRQLLALVARRAAG
jgi:DNA-binding PadR family transcriptional regulator